MRCLCALLILWRRRAQSDAASDDAAQALRTRKQIRAAKTASRDAERDVRLLHLVPQHQKIKHTEPWKIVVNPICWKMARVTGDAKSASH